MEKIGLVPAAGYARRLGNLNCSKEMLTFDIGYGEEPVCHSLFSQFYTAGIDKIVVVTRHDKIDLLEHLSKVNKYNLDITIVLLESTASTLESIFATYEIIKDKEVYLGFPDIIISPHDAMKRVVNTASYSEADVVLGAFPTSKPEKCDMIDMDDKGMLLDLKIKDSDCKYKFGWIFAKWNQAFTNYIYNAFKLIDLSSVEEIYIGDFIYSYYSSGKKIKVECIHNGKYTDIGTPEDLKKLRGKRG
jgi:glucose-1-phosphate thymidylyltransferase